MNLNGATDVPQPLTTARPTSPAAIATTTFAGHANKGWNRIPSIVIVGKPSDPRFAGVEAAIQWWTEELSGIGTPFHFGRVTENTTVDPDTLVPENLRTAAPDDPGDPISSGQAYANTAGLNADIVIALTHYDLTSRNLIQVKGGYINSDLILIKGYGAGIPVPANASATALGIAQHEIGHALGLMHDSSIRSIMCGAPWQNQKGCLTRNGQTVLEQDKQYLLTIYSTSWRPAP